MISINPAHFKYYIFSPQKNHVSPEASKVQKVTYNFWEELWNDKFSLSGAPDPSWRQHFFQQTYISTLWYKEEVASCHLYTKYNLDDNNWN